MRIRIWAISGLPALLVAASPAKAQIGEDLVVQPLIPQNFNRGRNLSVEEQPRPNYNPLGLRFGGMTLFQRVEAGAGATSNTYLTPDATASPTLFVRPSTRLVSDWSRHRLDLTGSATLRNYLGESDRNERVWNLGAQGRLDVRRNLVVEAEANASKAFETLFSGEVTSSVAALSRYRRDFASIQATYTAGRGRAFVLTDYTDLRFSPVPLVVGGIRDQSDRDRRITRVTGQLEYARSPSVSLFGQVSASRTRYDRDFLTGEPNLDSKAVRLLAGANIDIAGRIRGTVGVGYSIRDFDSGVYDTIRGVSVESRVELFPLQRLTLSATGQRTIEDATLNRTSFWNTRLGLRADYEVLRNLILNASGEYARQKYLASPLSGQTYRAAAGGRYLFSRHVVWQGALSFNRRSTNNARVLGGGAIDEIRAEMGLAYQL